ncbi:ABC transporter permease [Ruminococcus sp. OA3]|uniref:ABC transporter permease n=1 Tax=Ruminococcus sp. OA3 TaxID=2914164 RepID=UPI001F061167|nr:ABC transporter permease [Ruminococcus sp. OA3]MCH1984404.1 ABC transporter permease [Ruminococcus sp. OA3]
MLFHCIKAENLKIKHSCIWLACFLIPCIPAVMGVFNYLQNLELLKSGWYSLWSQLSLFYASFFYAPLIGLYCSYLWRLEHLNNNWNVLMTAPVPVSCTFLSKLTVILKTTLITQMWLCILFFLCGKFCGLPGFIPPEIILWLLRGTLAGIAIGALQLLLSMLIRSFSLPIGIALVGSFLGLLINNMGKGIYWPYSLMLIGMNSNKNIDTLAGGVWLFILSILIYSLFSIGTGIQILKRCDIKT